MRAYMNIYDAGGGFDTKRTEVWRVDAHGRNERRLTRTRNDMLDGAPSWSPDGSHIAFDRTGLEFREIYVMNRNGRALRRLTRSIDEKRWPAWSPDGRTIAFVEQWRERQDPRDECQWQQSASVDAKCPRR